MTQEWYQTHWFNRLFLFKVFLIMIVIRSVSLMECQRRCKCIYMDEKLLFEEEHTHDEFTLEGRIVNVIRSPVEWKNGWFFFYTEK